MTTDTHLDRLRNLADSQHPSYVGSEADAAAIRWAMGEIERLGRVEVLDRGYLERLPLRLKRLKRLKPPLKSLKSLKSQGGSAGRDKAGGRSRLRTGPGRNGADRAGDGGVRPVLIELSGGPFDGERIEIPDGFVRVEMLTVVRATGHRSGRRTAVATRRKVDYVKTLRSTADGARVFELEED